jgi:integrase
MPRQTASLSDIKCKTAKATDKPVKLFDGEGLFLYVKTNGSKVWRLKYRFGGKEKLMTLGSYPAVPLSDARELKNQARNKIAHGVDPLEYKKDFANKEKLAVIDSQNTFKSVSLNWLEWYRHTVSEKQFKRVSSSISNNLYGTLGNRLMKEISSADLIDALKPMEERGALDNLDRLFKICINIWKYALSQRPPLAERNVCMDIDSKYAFKQHKKANYKGTTDPEVLRALRDAINSYVGDIRVRQALKLSMYLFLRPSNVTEMRWTWIKGKNLEIPGKFMKNKKDFILPLSEQAIKAINEMKPFSYNSEFVFPSTRSTKRPLSNNTLNVAIKVMGFGEIQHAHGFRHTASTLLNENIRTHGVSSAAIEKALAHEKGGVEGVYNKAEYLEDRKILFQWWANYIDNL